jgi:hypothetical protein
VANVVVSEWTFWIACYGALVATGSLSWSVVKHFIDQSEKSKERKKIVVQFGIPIIKKNVPKIGEMYVFPLCVVNLGREDVIITSVEMRRSGSVFMPGVYNEPEAMLGVYSERKLPKRLLPGETLQLEQFTFAAFQDCPDEVVAIDAQGREYKVPAADLKSQYQEVQRYLDKHQRQKGLNR